MQGPCEAGQADDESGDIVWAVFVIDAVQDVHVAARVIVEEEKQQITNVCRTKKPDERGRQRSASEPSTQLGGGKSKAGMD